MAVNGFGIIGQLLIRPSGNLVKFMGGRLD
jgi:hypothetical protein